jgi:hypothetical protein
VEIFSACPFSISTLAWEPAPGRRSLCVSVKATFELNPGAAATIAPLQEALAEGGDLGESVPFKPRADVLITGHAHAPRGAPVDAILARARVGTVRKALSITGDRTWVPSFDGLRPSVAVPFRRMPLRYERAVKAGENAGGIDIIAQGAELGKALPNIAAIADQGGETPGFGPLPIAWRARRFGLGDAALLWASRVALSPGPPPAGFDFRLFNAAPSEQQLDEIPPGLEIQLENLHPEHAWLETRLPALKIRLFRLAPRADRAAEMPVRCDTLAIDADRGLGFLVWRGAVLLEGDAPVGRLVVAVEAEGERIGPEHADRLLAQLAPPVTYVEAGPAFGLAPGTGSAHPEAASSSYPPAAPAGSAAHKRNTLTPPVAGSVAAGLPFRAPPTGFEGAGVLPSLVRDSYPPPPPPKHALSPQPPPLPGHGTVPVPARPPSWGPRHDEGDEITPPRGYLATSAVMRAPAAPSPEPERTERGTLVPPVSAPPPRAAGGTLRPPASAPPSPPPPPRPTPTPAMGPPPPPRPTPTPAMPQPTPATPPVSEAAAALSRTATGTVRPPAPSLAGLPFARAAEVVATVTQPPATDPDPPREFSDPPPPTPRHPELGGGGLALASYCAVRVEAWQGAPLGEVLARHGVTEAAYQAFEREQAEALAREAAEGRSDRAVALVEALRAARGGA